MVYNMVIDMKIIAKISLLFIKKHAVKVLEKK